MINPYLIFGFGVLTGAFFGLIVAVLCFAAREGAREMTEEQRTMVLMAESLKGRN